MDPDVDPHCYARAYNAGFVLVDSDLVDEFEKSESNGIYTYDCEITKVISAQSDGDNRSATLFCLIDSGHDDAELEIPVHGNAEIPLSPGDTVHLRLTKSVLSSYHFSYGDNVHFSSLVIEDENDIPLYASIMQFNNGWVDNIDGLNVEARSYGCPKVDAINSYQEALLLHFSSQEGDELDLKAGEMGVIRVSGMMYSVLNIESFISLGEPSSNEAFLEDGMSQYVLVLRDRR